MKFKMDVGELINLDEIGVRKTLGKEHCVMEQIGNLKALLKGFDVDHEKWADVSAGWDEIIDTIEHLNISFNHIDNTIRKQKAAQQVEKILSAGFDFDQIKVDGFSFNRGGNGCIEEWSPEDVVF